MFKRSTSTKQSAHTSWLSKLSSLSTTLIMWMPICLATWRCGSTKWLQAHNTYQQFAYQDEQNVRWGAAAANLVMRGWLWPMSIESALQGRECRGSGWNAWLTFAAPIFCSPQIWPQEPSKKDHLCCKHCSFTQWQPYSQCSPAECLSTITICAAKKQLSTASSLSKLPSFDGRP